MHKWKELYKEKMLTAEEIAEFIGSNTVCVCPIAAGEPVAIPRAIAQRAIKDNLVGIVQYSLLSIVNNDLWNNTDLDGKFNHTTLYCGTNGVREAIFAKRADFIPSFYSQIPRVVNEYIKPDVFYATVSPMDEHGYFSFGTSISNSMMMKKVAKKVYLEVNNHMPKTHGNSFIHITEVDGLCEMNRELPELKSSPLSETEMTIGNYIAELVPDGAVIQLGIGGIPNAAALALRGKRDLGIHSELFTESMVDLIDQGVVTNKKKNIHEGKSVATFAFGTKRMYDYLNDNVGLEFHPVDYVNNPNVIGQNDNMVSINSCIEVDLMGQVNSESIGLNQYSGPGGQVDYVQGVRLSKGGKSIIAIPSTAAGGKLSRIVPFLSHGAAVTTSRNDVDYVVTEYGIAHLRGRTLRERAKMLIGLAHPNFREELMEEFVRRYK